MAEAFVLETLRTARTKASPRGGFGLETWTPGRSR